MRYVIFTGLCLTSLTLEANVLQYLAGLSYANPAELFKVKKNDLIVGAMGMDVHAKFTGSVLNFNTTQYDQGVSHSKRASLLPFGRIATRVNKTMVVGVDFTEPFHSNLAWGKRSITRYASTATLMRDNDVSPRVSIALNKQLYVGGGLNFNFLNNNETDWALPISQTEYAELVNKTSSFGVGYNLGLYYAFNQTNFFGASYYSVIKQKTRGESRFGDLVNNDIRFNFSMPPTTIVNYVHIFSKKWLASIQAFRSEWNANQYATIRNTAATPPSPSTFVFPMKYKASIAFSGAVRRQMNEKTGLTLIGMIDDGPERDRLRTINFPSDKQYFLALATDYHITNTVSLEFLGGFVISNTNIQNQITFSGPPVPFTTGRVGINAGVADLRIKVQV